ncbi:methyltransferase [candidate division KSB1 bacterium]|nr:methyltransferase [candidate division KSB1 bacterium]NIV70807.1 methyltransferase [Phycisphaerae bacterium]NIR72925.1 methyltransferase [candidate division KSB1 bacterium]NIT73723.1 methyltransferase [candidate division KSB1 bacterium]NIU27595.1 methyltransferase [candidate division KSB1 bacterium]
MSSRERVKKALNYQEPDRIPLDLGGSGVTGMHVSTVYKLRQALGLDAPGTPVKVIEPYQLLGEIQPDLIEALGIDVVELTGTGTMFGFEKRDWKPWTTFDGTPVLVPGGFNTEPEPDGRILMYPEGDTAAPPSGEMPPGGCYFDTIIRQDALDPDNLNIEDNTEEFKLISDEDLEYFSVEAERLFGETDKAIFASFAGLSFGDIAQVPAPWLKHPRGIRDIEEWYISLTSRRDFVKEIFERQCEIALTNLRNIYDAVGDRISVILVSATDFGLQTGPFLSPSAYRDLFKPYNKRINDWIHQNTPWKTFIHSCGSVLAFIPDFIEAGFDILNPVQTAAADMDPTELKRRFGDQITFWGGGVDTQNTLPFGTPDQVREEVRERIRTLGPGGGFVFNTIHNVQPKVPIENVLAMYGTLREYGRYPIVR